jgi:class 3 adenylate cyclase
MLRRSASKRRLATVLFVDIVDSTRVAAEIGDRPWRDLLGSFRAIVRTQLRRHGGREQDTAGDGFLATFEQPAAALRAAASIAGEVQRLGIDVRCAVHAGEVETIDGRAGGIAVHIGARILAPQARPRS